MLANSKKPTVSTSNSVPESEIYLRLLLPIARLVGDRLFTRSLAVIAVFALSILHPSFDEYPIELVRSYSNYNLRGI